MVQSRLQKLSIFAGAAYEGSSVVGEGAEVNVNDADDSLIDGSFTDLTDPDDSMVIFSFSEEIVKHDF
jgi:hypothetical protein